MANKKQDHSFVMATTLLEAKVGFKNPVASLQDANQFAVEVKGFLRRRFPSAQVVVTIKTEAIHG